MIVFRLLNISCILLYLLTQVRLDKDDAQGRDRRCTFQSAFQQYPIEGIPLRANFLFRVCICSQMILLCCCVVVVLMFFRHLIITISFLRKTT
jgi:hypothetical protein